MENVKIALLDEKLIIEVDLSVKGSPSASGKTLVLASTRGNTPVAPNVYLGLNVFKFPER